MIYLDNAATSFPKPPCVIKEVTECIEKYCANPGRSSHKLSLKTDEEIYRAREAVSGIFHLESPENVCFTQNTTYALNLAIKSSITEKCHVIISDMEHNSVLRPIYKLKRTLGVEFSVFSTEGDIKKSIEELIREDTKAIVSTLMSNVTGKKIPLSVLSEIARSHNLMLIVDAAQLAGHEDINLSTTPCNILCAPGHKGLFGIQGCGFAIFSDSRERESFIEGGTGSNSKSPFMPKLLPERFEAGTLATPSIVSLRSGIEFLNSFGIEGVRNRLWELSEMFCERISSLKDSKIYGTGGGIIAFEIKGIPSGMIAKRLDENDIYVRSGLHCAPMAHETLGSSDNGLVRVSLSIFNTEKDADALYKALRSM